jgi:hypothetical protein
MKFKFDLRDNGVRIVLGRVFYLLLGVLFLTPPPSFGQNDLVQVHENFSTDPGWDGWQNRVVGLNNPTIHQDFGWSETTHIGPSMGELGGTIFGSTTPAQYGMPLGKPLSFKDVFSASGMIAVMPGPDLYPAYIGFFNSQRQGWRPWNSLAIRVNPTGDTVRFYIDYKTGEGTAGGLDTDLAVPIDGAVHTWEIIHDPSVRVDMNWPDPQMPEYLTGNYEPVGKILERAKKYHPDLTHDRLQQMLNQGRDQGIVGHWLRKGIDTYWKRRRPESYKGQVSLRIDDHAYKTFMIPGFQEAEVVIDRFGIFNFQLYHGRMEFYVGDLTINGHQIDLTQDPRWEGRGNRVTFVEPDFHEKMDFGYSQTHWAGDEIGELGGRFYSTETRDPMHGYYADEIGGLSLEDPLSLSGTLCFVDAGPDARVFLGWFNAKETKDPMDQRGEEEGYPVSQSLGLSLRDSSDISHMFTAICSPTFELETHHEGPYLAPMRERRHFSLSYDPAANKGIGQITYALDDVVNTLNLTPEQRQAGARFDRFGVMNVRRGGKYVDIYFDDLTYTARRAKDHKPIHHKQETVTYPYPRGGRKM